MIADKINQFYVSYKKWQIHKTIPDWFWAEAVYSAKVSPSKLKYDQQTNKIYLSPFDFYISKENPKYHFLLQEANLRLGNRLRQEFKAKFSVDEDLNLVIDIAGIKAKILCEQDLEIVKELFEQGVYNFIDNVPLVVIDIGMNIGWASLYFASQDNVKSVYSYEPFKTTFQEALDNFKLNPQLSSKINPFDYGLSNEEKTITVEYDYDVKASIGVEGIASYKSSQNTSLRKEDILVKDASQNLKPIFEKYPDIDFMAKIDCEGSEYEILASLDQSNLLKKFKIIIMEWHEKGPTQLEEYLQKNGFTIFSRRPKSKTIGMIYAVRS